MSLQLITEPGIYFDLPDEVYHASAGLSSSAIKELLISPLDYWANYRNPAREKHDTAAHIFGKAMHRRTLEGENVFYSHYAIEPDPADYPDALTTIDQLKLILKKHGYELGGTKEDKIRRVLFLEPETVIWEDIIRKWKEENAHDGKTILKVAQGKDIETRATIIESHKDAQKAFKGGRAEVSIFWDDEETGIRMKARLDYLKLKAIIDLKTFTNQRRVNVDQAIGMAFANYQYFIQGFVYLRAIEAAKKMLNSDDKPSQQMLEFISDENNSTFIENLMNSEGHEFWFVFVESGKAPNIRVRRFDKKNDHGITNAYWHQAEMCFHRAASVYSAFLEAYPEPEMEWHEYVKRSPFIDEDFPMYMLD